MNQYSQLKLKVLILFIGFLFVLPTSRAQSQLDTTADYIRKLQIDSFAVYTVQCESSFSFFSFFKKGEKFYFLNSLPNTTKVKIISLDSMNPFRYYLDNIERISTDSINHFTYFKSPGSTDTSILVVSNSCKLDFRFCTKNEIYNTISVNELDLKEISSDGKVNIYSDANRQNKSVTLFKLIQELIDKLKWSKSD